MITIRNISLAAIIPLFVATSVFAEGPVIRTMTCAFDNPGKPGVIKIISGSGNITIAGYAGSDVKIKASSSDEEALPPVENEKAKGLKRIAGTGFNVTTDKDDNAIVITRSMDNETDLDIQAPYNSSLKIGGDSGNGGYGTNSIQDIVISSMKIAFDFSGVFEGNITISNIKGEMEINTLDGNIDLKDISGAVVANAMDGDIKAVFKTVAGDRPMAFSTMDGDIDVTLPTAIKATVKAITVDGDVYTDFDIEIIPEKAEEAENPATSLRRTPGPQAGPKKPEVRSSIGSGQKIPDIFGGMVGTTVTGNINGGGSDIQLKTVDGSLYIRKAK